MAKRGFLNTQTLMKFVRLGALAAPAVRYATDAGISTKGKIFNVIRAYTGFDPHNNQFDFRNLAEGWLPYLASVLITHGIPKVAGIIRRM